jgi:hypothetical protein
LPIASQHNLLSEYAHLKDELTKIVLCPTKKCSAILTMQKNKNFPEENQSCDVTKALPVFLCMPIEKQIKYFIEHHGVLHEKWDPNWRGGVQSGSFYQELREKG